MYSDENKNWWEELRGYIKIPKALFANPQYKKVSLHGKVLYGFLMDRTSLSASKGERWKTAENQYYVVYTIDEITRRLCCGHDKATKILRELENAGLITRTRKSRSQAYHIVVYPAVVHAEKQESRERGKSCGESVKSAGNNTDNNYLDVNDPDVTTHITRERRAQEVKIKIEYDILTERIPKCYLDAIVDVIVSALSTPKDYVWVSGKKTPTKDVQKRLDGVTDMDIVYVYDRLRRDHHDIQHLPGYILARLLERDHVKEVYYDRWVSLDLEDK